VSSVAEPAVVALEAIHSTTGLVRAGIFFFCPRVVLSLVISIH
jgi:hypothetical protein